jgi:hypothetical protein
MKNTMIIFLLTICICFGYNTSTKAAFPIKSDNITTITHSQKQAVTNLTTDPDNHKRHRININVKNPLNPEHPVGDAFSIASLVLGGLSILVGIFSLSGFVIGLVAIILSFAALHMEGIKKYAQWGLALGIIGAVIALIAHF